MKYFRNVVAFAKTVEQGSFTSAAAALGVSPAAVSKSVQNLERGLGVRLLNRSTRRLALTEEGGVFYRHCRSAMLEFDNALSAVAEKDREPTGVLRVTSATTFGRTHVVPLLSEFTTRFPKVTLDFVLEDRFVDLVHEEYDVCIRLDASPPGSLVAKRIVSVQAIVCGSPAYFRRHPIPRHPEDLLSHDCIRFRSLGTRRVLDWEFQRDGKAFLQPMRRKLILTDPEGICGLVARGHGLGQIPSYLAVPLIAAAKLKPVLLDYLSQSRTIYVCHSRGKYLAPRIRAFADFLVEKLVKDPTVKLELPKRR